MDDSFSDERKIFIEDELDEALDSRQFVNAPIVRAFLEFVVNETVAERGDRLNAYSIASEVFGRSSDFDPSSDTIVRTTAGRVRKALEAYNSESEKDRRVAISLPKGGYAPAFEFRDAPPSPGLASYNLSSLARSLFSRPGILMAACMFAVVAIGSAAFFAEETKSGSLPANVVIDVRPVEYIDQKARPFAWEIDNRLASALSRIGLAEISPPAASPRANEGAPAAEGINAELLPDSWTDFWGGAQADSIVFILKTYISDAAEPNLRWQLIDRESDQLVRASRERLAGTDTASIDRAVDKVAFQVLGSAGAVPSILERYHGEIFSRPTCIFRAQIMGAIANDIAYPKIRDCLERIVATSPNDASAWAAMSIAGTYRSTFYSVGDSEERAIVVKHAERAAERAVELAPTAYLTRVALLHLSLRQRRFAEFDRLQREFRKNYPGDVFLHIHIATRLARLGRGQEALEIFDRAENDFGINLKNWAPGIAVAYFVEGQYEQAHGQMLRATSNLRFVLVLRAAILGKLNMADEAAPVIDKLVATNPDIKETFYPWLTGISWAEPLILEIADGLARAGLVVNVEPPAIDRSAEPQPKGGL